MRTPDVTCRLRLRQPCAIAPQTVPAPPLDGAGGQGYHMARKGCGAEGTRRGTAGNADGNDADNAARGTARSAAMIRPALRDWLRRQAEPLSALAVSAFGLWLALRGGWFFLLLGAFVVLIGAALLVGAWRRLPFRRPVDAPGVVEVVEGAIRFYGAHTLGGEIALRDLVEIRLLRLKGHGHWRLRNAAGEALLIPVDAAGADALAHAFTALPGLDMGEVSAALAHVADQSDAVRTVWRRPVRRGLT